MDFLDPKKQKQHRLMLLVGYALITLVIAIVSVVLIYQGGGYGVDSKGQVIRSGLVFVSSQPTKADITLNGIPYKSQTDTRMVLPSETYTIKLTAAGYRSWQRDVTVLGGDVQRFDYPLLFPASLKTTSLTTYEKPPVFTSQSPDSRWLIIKPNGDTNTFTQYDFKNTTPSATTLTIPAEVYTTGDTAGSWAAVEWSTDNKHLLLLHTYTAGAATDHEYIVLDRSSPEASVNVTRTLNLPATETLSLFNKKYTQYYAFDALAGSLRTTSLDSSLDPTQLDHVVAFKSYGSDTLLYATSQPPTGKVVDGKVSVVLRQGQKTYTLRTLTAGASLYNLEIARYDSDWYMAVGSSSEAGVYLFRNPQQQTLTASALPSPWRFMRLSNATRVAFSPNAQFILFESGQQFVVYDAENVRTYRYAPTHPIDTPQAYAVWMDGSRLTYVSGGKQVVFDYDYQNVQTLQSNSSAFAPVFDPNLKAAYSFAPVGATGSGKVVLTRTALTIEK